MLGTMNEWTLGQCANCDKPLDQGAPPTLYCSERCKGYARMFATSEPAVDTVGWGTQTSVRL